MTDVETQKDDYQARLRQPEEVSGEEAAWLETEPDSTVSLSNVNPNVNTDVPDMTNSKTSPVCAQTEDSAHYSQSVPPTSTQTVDAKMQENSNLPDCGNRIDAGVDTAPDPESVSVIDAANLDRKDNKSEDASEPIPKEHVFQITMEGETLNADANRTEDQIYYLPLAVGSSGGKPEERNFKLTELAGLGVQQQSDNVLRDLGKPLSQMAESKGSTASISNESIETVGSRPLSQVEGSTMTSSTTTSSFLTSKSTLVTDSLLKTGSIPESITQQFNQIAKLNKSSLRSRRTVRTTTTRVTPGQMISTPVSSAVGSATKDSSFEVAGTSSANSTGGHTMEIPMSGRLAKGLQTSLSSSSSPQPSLFVHSDPKRAIHARFHSDETKPMTDFGSPVRWPSNPSSSEQTSPVATTESGTTAPTPARQPVTYVRSVTAERLPVFIRSGGNILGNVGVLRSKSAAGTISANRRVTSSQVDATDGSLIDRENLMEAHRSLPESSLGSHCHSSGPNGSEDGSTSSLPSLSTGGGSPITAPVTLESQNAIPAGSDPGLLTKSPREPTGTSIGPNQKPDSPAPSGVGLVKDQQFKRPHIMKELIQVEKEYVNALATLVNSYMIPLKQDKILDDQQVDTIFYKVNELLNYHMSFLNTLQMWELTNTVGDKLVDMFSQEAVAACYCSFVENFPNSEKTLETCFATKSSFQKFCEQKLRMMPRRLPLKSLLVQPIQRLPRYELLVKRLIEYTPEHFSDKALLKEAQNAIHELIIRVNTVQSNGQDESLLDGTKLLDRLLSPATLTPNRVYIRHDIVSIEDRKEPVCIFMFTDQIVFTLVKRRGTQAKKAIVLRLQSPKGLDTIENVNYKIFHRLGIEAIEFEPCEENKTDSSTRYRDLRDKNDLAFLAEIANISTKPEHRHHDSDSVVRALYQPLQFDQEELRSTRGTTTVIPKTVSVFTATTKEGIERYELNFSSSAKRRDWELTVMELKRQLSSVKRTAHFYGSLEVPRTLSGIQLSCSAVVEVTHLTRSTPRDVWICASDGYTGYICLLTLHPRPMIYLNIPLAGCNSRITCICAVPGLPIPNIRRASGNHGLTSVRPKSTSGNIQTINKPRLSLSKSDETVETIGLESKDRSKSQNAVPSEPDPRPAIEDADIITTSSTRKSSGSQLDDDSATLCYVRTQTSNSPLTTPPDTPTLQDIIEDSAMPSEYEADRPEANEVENAAPSSRLPESSYFSREVKCPSEPSLQDTGTAAGTALRMDSLQVDEQEAQASDYSDSSEVSDADNEIQDETSSSQTTQTTSKDSSNEAPTEQCDSLIDNKASKLLDPHRPTMWLGTEEGTIFIFYANDNIKTSRQRQQIKLSSAINSILQLDVRIFVACTNGDFFVYDRNSDGLWDVDSPRLLRLNPDQETPVVVRRMLAVAGNIWCAAHRFVYVLNSVTLKVELSFPLNGNPADPRGIQLMAYGNQTVWLATENSPRVSLYHATTGEFLMEIDLKPIVIQSLQHCDEIVMRHKEACLRITCLTVCKDLLWAGTSAGAIVTVAIPRVTLTSTKHNMEPPQLEVLKKGHIGHVRFLVSLESVSEPETTSTSERPRISLSPMRESIASKPEVSSKGSASESLVSEATDKSEIKSETKSESRPTSVTEQKKPNQLEALSSTPCLRSPQPPPRPKPPNLMLLQQARRNESNTTQESTSSASAPSVESRLSISPSHRHCLLGVRRASVNPCTTIATQMKVISGGDGLEEFNTCELVSSTPEVSTSEDFGDNDSMNQILIWDVH